MQPSSTQRKTRLSGLQSIPGFLTQSTAHIISIIFRFLINISNVEKLWRLDSTSQSFSLISPDRAVTSLDHGNDEEPDWRLSSDIIRAEEESFLIYNYQPFYAGKEGRDWGFQQAYVF